MATNSIEFKGKIYIPPCLNKVCDHWRSVLAEELSKNVICITENRINGSFIYHFKRLLDECDFTILHLCPFLWHRISKHQDCLLKNETKLIMISFEEVKLTETERTTNEKNCLDVANFFSDFDATQLINNDALTLLSFKEQILACLPDKDFIDNNIISESTTTSERDILSGKTTSESYTTTQYFLQGDSEKTEDDSEDEQGEANFSYEQWQQYFENENNPPIFVEKKFIKFDGHKEITFTQTELHALEGEVQKINQLEEKYSKEEDITTLKFIMMKLLPKFHKEKDIVRLASFSMCKHSHVQEKALNYMELILIESSQDMKILIHVDLILTNALLKMRGDSELSNFYAPILIRVANISLLVLALIMQGLSDPETHSKCASYLSTRSKTLFLPPKSFQEEELFDAKAQQMNAQVWLGILDHVLADANKSQHVTKSVEQYLNSLQKPKSHLQKKMKKSAVHLLVTLKLLTQIHCLDMDAVSNLKTYVTAFKENTHFFSYMILHSLTLFLHFKHDTHSNRDLHQFYEEINDIIELTIPCDPIKQIDCFLERLLFHTNSTIRCSMIRLFYQSDRYGQQCVVKYLQDQLEHLLRPLLCDLKLLQNQDTKAFGWKSASGQFHGQAVCIYFHSMTQKDHKRNRKEFKENEDFRYTEMKHLASLQHKNIIKMLAYQHDCIPQFYILEKFEDNLQVNLKNKRKNENFYTPVTLLQFLIDAVSGLDYCLRKKYVHCNLTGESLIVVDGNYVKLGGFGLCKKIEESTGKAMEVNSKSIPLRWSAPESILNGEFSKESDVWMFGHLIYEIMTHGVFPYSNIDKSDEDLIELMKTEKLKLTFELPIEKKAIQKLLSDCVAYKVDMRTHPPNIKASLKSILIKARESTQKKFEYPKLNDRNMSVTLRKGVPEKFYKETTVKSSQSMKFSVKLSEAMIRIMEGEDFIFKEKLYHKFSSSMESYFKSSPLDKMLPERREIVQSPNEMPFIECKIPNRNCVCLLKTVLNKKMKDQKEVVFLMYHVAALLKDLAKESFIIGHLCASNVYILAELSGGFIELSTFSKVYIVSLAYLNKLDNSEDVSQTHHMILSLPENIRRRAAPEVIKSGFSTATDIFCFGNFMWELLTAFEYGDPLLEGLLKIFKDVAVKDIYDKIHSGEWEKYHPKPKGCSDSLYELIKSCVSVSAIERPSIDHVAVKLREFCGMKSLLESDNWHSDDTLTRTVRNPSASTSAHSMYSAYTDNSSHSQSSRIQSNLSSQTLNETVYNPSMNSEDPLTSSSHSSILLLSDSVFNPSETSGSSLS